jgi:hypothetical protein
MDIKKSKNSLRVIDQYQGVFLNTNTEDWRLSSQFIYTCEDIDGAHVMTYIKKLDSLQKWVKATSLLEAMRENRHEKVKKLPSSF